MLIAFPLFAQSFKIEKTVGEFSDAISFSLTPTNYFYVTDQESNEVHKVGLNGSIISSAGGYGWETESFDLPIDIYATTLNVYVTDHNNSRIQIFDKDLNYLSIITSNNFTDERSKFNYPRACVVSNQGDLFILDGDNSRVLKYDVSGNQVTEIGNIDAGSFALNNPVSIALSNDGKIFVLDEKAIVVFDLFGSPITKIRPRHELRSINIYNNYLTGNDYKSVLIWDLIKPGNGIKEFESTEIEEEFVESIFDGNKLYILTNRGIIFLTRTN